MGGRKRKIANPFSDVHIGLVDIRGGPIVAINALKQDGSQHNPPQWWAVLLIPIHLPGAADHPVKISSRGLKSFPCDWKSYRRRMAG